jgi:hypothetical protein
MEINLLNDLIVDEYGNYYVAIGEKSDGGKPSEYTLANAFMDIAFYEVISENYYKEHQYEHVGRNILDILNDHIENCELGKSDLKLVKLSELRKSCTVYFIPLFERNPMVK